jgi:hypothetical protein
LQLPLCSLAYACLSVPVLPNVYPSNFSGYQVSLLHRLFTYKETSSRSPLEDFLTEALCALLNELDRAGVSSDALSYLFGWSDVERAKLTWESQYVIPPSAGRAAGKRPDLVAQGTINGKSAFLIVENKIRAGFTAHEDANSLEIFHQLDLYQEFLQWRNEKITDLRLLTFLTAPPREWPQEQVCSWQKLHAALRALLEGPLKDSAPVAAFLARNLAHFLKEQGMAEVKLTLNDIAALPAWQRLQDACIRLRDRIWPSMQAHGTFLEHMRTAGFGPTHGRQWDEFGSADKFFYGMVFTPLSSETGKPCPVSDTAAVFWTGILLSRLYELIGPRTADVPELQAGFAIWIDKTGFKSSMVETMQKIAQGFCSVNPKAPWKVEHRDSPTSPTTHYVLTLTARESFLEMYGQVDDWVEEVDAFVKARMDEIANLASNQLAALKKWHDAEVQAEQAG